MKIEIPEKKKLVHEMTFPVRWGDMDAMGHVNNTVYFRYMEMARVDWVHSLKTGPVAQDQGCVIVNAFCNFYRQFEYPDVVTLRTYISDPGRSSFETWVTMARAAEPDTVCAAGGATVVWVDFAAGKSASLPDWLRQHLE